MTLTPAESAAVLDLLRTRHGLDFSDYRPELVERTLGDHAARSGQPDGAAFLAALSAGGDTLGALSVALSVRVTSFFRDLAVFEDLAHIVLPGILECVTSEHGVRCWVVGCATGEEAWSIAMLMAAACGPRSWTVLATDIDRAALEVAERGVYRDVAGVPAQLAERFLASGDGQGHTIRPELRKNVRFVEHNLVGHRLAPAEAIIPSFHVVSCRNLLLHFDARLRERAWPRLEGVTHRVGAMLLGSVETPPPALGFRRWPTGRPNSPIFRRRTSL